MTRGCKRILVVDDEQDICLTLKTVLEKYGILVDCFSDPIMALKSFKSDFYDLVILDVKMPEVSGFLLYNQFKLKDPKIKTLFLTALNDVEPYNILGSELYPKRGERHFLHKPMSNRELLEQVYFMTNWQ